MSFNLVSDYQPSGDQPQAIESLISGVESQKKHQVLLGVTGSGKTFTMANVIATLNRPTLVLAHNKTLAAQLCSEFKTFFPDNAVEYFVSYYDYYQPEAYVSSRDVYIEKEAQINEEIERLRHSATRSLLTRQDVIIVASVSCIYGLGTPEAYMNGVLSLRVGQDIGRREFLKQLTDIYYERNDIELMRGRFRVKGDVIDIFPSWDELAVRVELFGDEIDRIVTLHPLSGEVLGSLDSFDVFPASHYVVEGGMDDALLAIEDELKERHRHFMDQGMLVEGQRINQRTRYDIEMMRQMGYCKGIENYARHLSGAKEGEPPGVLLDFFPDDFLTIIDESHVSVPQIGGMYKGDRSRKQTLVDFGFRLPSALDNRPLQFSEFENRVNCVIYTSATPGNYELEKVEKPNPISDEVGDRYDVVEQVIRPTGLLDPIIHVRPSEGQMNDLLDEITTRVQKEERVLVTTVTKQLSEDIADFLSTESLKVMYLHSDIGALERIDILRDLRLGTYDVLVGVNLLREGLDLPEVSLVAILDADKEGFLRNERSLIQTMGRAARHPEGTVILYADSITPSMTKAVNETKRRRKKQHAHNQVHGITPTPIVKEIKDIRDENRDLIQSAEAVKVTDDPKEVQALVAQLEKKMHEAADNLEFELAAVLRDQLNDLTQSKN
ncbi:excinuclease ABC subunit B [Candidatus Marinamargulisbacteria bacterium SCGC AG-343-K17]|nr:excinuclease ABC subunit B [Candidatus Marinamargulisbacteria bacterium SCGC AG-343-K17]